MTRLTRMIGVVLGAIVALPTVAQVQPATRLAATIDLFGARIGMTRDELLARTPATAMKGQSCTTAPSGDPRLLFLECGPHKLTVDFTAADTAWQLRASYDFTDTPLPVEDARAALVVRYGAPTATPAGGSLIWLAQGTPAVKAGPCAGSAMLLSAAIEQRDAPGVPAAPLPSIDPACLPIRTAILAGQGGHRGVIVEVQDARPRLAELARGTRARAAGRR